MATGDTYSIKDLSALEDVATSISTYSQTLYNNVESLKWISSNTRANWENPEGVDLQSILTTIDENTKVLEETIIPLLKEYSMTIYELVLATRATQSKEVSDTSYSAVQFN